MNIREELLAAAVRELGVREEGGNNKGARIQDYMRATWMPEAAIQAGFPWCASFCAFVLRAALIKAGVAPALADRWRCRDASAFGWIGWAHHAPGCMVLPASAAPDPADIVVYDFNGPTAAGGGHIGFVEHDVPGDAFVTIEGNTNDAGARDSATGDGVLRKTRGMRTVVNFIRLPDRLS